MQKIFNCLFFLMFKKKKIYDNIITAVWRRKDTSLADKNETNDEHGELLCEILFWKQVFFAVFLN